jgi:hypothetical protein
MHLNGRNNDRTSSHEALEALVDPTDKSLETVMIE